MMSIRYGVLILLISFFVVSCSDLPDNIPPEPFRLLTPANSQLIFLSPAQTIPFSWEEAIDPDGTDQVTYHLIISQVDSTGNLGQDVFHRRGLVTTYLMIDASELDASVWAQDSTQLVWQVIATDGEAETPCEQPFYLTVSTLNQAPRPFDLLSPADNFQWVFSTVEEVIELRWQRTTDPNGDDVTYTVVIDDNPTFDSPELRIDHLTDNLLELTGAMFHLTLLPPETGGAFYWRVMATDGELDATSSQTFMLSVQNNIPNQPPAAIELHSPVEGALVEITSTSGSLTFDWSAATDPEGEAVQYQWILANDPNLTSRLLTVDTGTDTVMSLANSEIVNLVLVQGSPSLFGFWGVIASDGVKTTQSDGFGIELVLNIPPRPFDLLSPVDNSRLFIHRRSESYTMTWAASSDPDGDLVLYRWLLDQPGGDFQLPVANRSTGTETSINLAANFWINLLVAQQQPDMNFDWNVRAVDVDDNMRLANAPFSVRVTLDLWGDFQLQSPENEVILTDPGARVLFDWAESTDFNGDRSYDLRFSSGGSWDDFHPALASVNAGTSTQVQLTVAELETALGDNFTGYWTVYAVPTDQPLLAYRSADVFYITIDTP